LPDRTSTGASVSADLSLRPTSTGDREILFAIYGSTRQDELALVPWSEQQKLAFLEMQFAAQTRFYAEQFPQAAHSLVLRAGQPVGRLIIDRRPDEIRLIDIALLPGHRGAGIGTALLQAVFADARAAGKPVRIHVERFNPAQRLYLRLGFRVIGDEGVYFLMEWQPGDPADPQPVAGD
jgi:ribosomal protein S18 acetylase RimI-like enzyme